MTTSSTPTVPSRAAGAPVGDAAEVPTTGDGPVDEAMVLLATVRPGGGAQDGQVLAAVHALLQRRLSAATG